MSRDNTKIYRDRGSLAVPNGTDLGYTSFQSPGFNLYLTRLTEDIMAEDYGNTPMGVVHMGWDCRAVIYLAQKDGSVMEAAFDAYNTGTTTTIDADAVQPGTRLDSGTGKVTKECVWTGALWKVTFYNALCQIVPNEPIYHGLLRENAIPLLLRAYPDASHQLVKVELM